MQKNFFNKDRKNKKMIIAISVSVAIIVIGLAVFCYFLFANEKENNAKNKAENAQEDPQAKIEEEKEEAKVQLPDLKASQPESMSLNFRGISTGRQLRTAELILR